MRTTYERLKPMVLQPLIKKYEILLHVGDPSYRDALAQFDLGFVMAEDLEKARELADKTVLEPKHLLATFNEFAQEAGHPPGLAQAPHRRRRRFLGQARATPETRQRALWRARGSHRRHHRRRDRVAERVGPGDLETRNVFPIDLGQGGKTIRR